MNHRCLLFTAALGWACGPAVGTPGESSDDTTTSGTSATSSPGTSLETTVTSSPGTSAGTMPEPTTVATTIDPDTSTDASDECGEGCCDFLCPPDVAGLEIECDLWAQDCPKGEKCTPWAND